MAEESEDSMGQRLQRLRRKAGLSQFDLAKAADIPINTVRSWEQDISVPRFDTAIKMAKALGISLDLLAGAVPEREEKKPKAKRPK